MRSVPVEIFTRDQASAYHAIFDDGHLALEQQSLAWADVISPLGPDQAFFFVAFDNAKQALAGLPLYLFQSPLGAILTSVPQAGPLGGVVLRQGLRESAKQPLYAALVRKMVAFAQEQKCIASTIITHPFLRDRDFYLDVPPAYHFENFTQAIRLGDVFADGDRINAGSSKNNTRIRRNLARAREAGITIDWGTPADFDSWYEIHQQRHTELGATPLPKAFLKVILERDSNHAGLLIARRNTELIGGCVYVWSKKVVDVFMLSSRSEFLDSGVNYAISAAAIQHFERRRFEWFNWQSSQRNSGVYDFKKQWGSEEYPYWFLTWTYPGFEPILERSVTETAAFFPWHYLAPYEALNERKAGGFFKKR